MDVQFDNLSLKPETEGGAEESGEFHWNPFEAVAAAGADTAAEAAAATAAPPPQPPVSIPAELMDGQVVAEAWSAAAPKRAASAEERAHPAAPAAAIETHPLTQMCWDVESGTCADLETASADADAGAAAAAGAHAGAATDLETASADAGAATDLETASADAGVAAAADADEGAAADADGGAATDLETPSAGAEAGVPAAADVGAAAAAADAGVAPAGAAANANAADGSAADQVAAAYGGSSSSIAERVSNGQPETVAAAAGAGMFHAGHAEVEFGAFGDAPPAMEEPAFAATAAVPGDSVSRDRPEAYEEAPLGAPGAEPAASDDSAASGSEDGFAAFDDAPPIGNAAMPRAEVMAAQSDLNSRSGGAGLSLIELAPRDFLQAATLLLEELLQPAVGATAAQLGAAAALPTLAGLAEQFPSLEASCSAGAAIAAGTSEAGVPLPPGCDPSAAEARLLARLGLSYSSDMASHPRKALRGVVSLEASLAAGTAAARPLQPVPSTDDPFASMLPGRDDPSTSSSRVAVQPVAAGPDAAAEAAATGGDAVPEPASSWPQPTEQQWPGVPAEGPDWDAGFAAVATAPAAAGAGPMAEGLDWDAGFAAVATAPAAAPAAPMAEGLDWDAGFAAAATAPAPAPAAPTAEGLDWDAGFAAAAMAPAPPAAAPMAEGLDWDAGFAAAATVPAPAAAAPMAEGLDWDAGFSSTVPEAEPAASGLGIAQRSVAPEAAINAPLAAGAAAAATATAAAAVPSGAGWDDGPGFADFSAAPPLQSRAAAAANVAGQPHAAVRPFTAAEVTAIVEDTAWAPSSAVTAAAAAAIHYEAGSFATVHAEEVDEFADFAEAEPPASSPPPEAASAAATEAEAAVLAQQVAEALTPAMALQQQLSDLSFMLSSEI